MKFLIFILPAVLLNSTAFSFSTPPDSVRDHYVESYPDKFYLKPIFTIRNLGLQLESRNSPLVVKYSPNAKKYIGLGAFVFNVGLETSFKLPTSSGSNSRFGETDVLDLQTNIYAKKWGADIAYQRYKGFYLANPSAHYPSWSSSQPYPQRADLKVRNISGNVFYLLNNRKFSYRSAYNQADRQRRSGGSFLIGINYTNHKIEADSTLIPETTRSIFQLDKYSNTDFESLGFLPGYTYSFIYKYFYLNLSLSAGPSYFWSEYSEGGTKVSESDITSVVNIRAALGYNSPKWFTGITFVSQTSNLITDYLDISGESGNIKIFFGIRFEEKGILRKEIL